MKKFVVFFAVMVMPLLSHPTPEDPAVNAQNVNGNVNANVSANKNPNAMRPSPKRMYRERESN